MSEDIANVDDPEIEATPEMIEAGAREVLAYDRRVLDEYDLAEFVYDAMEKARNKKRT